MALTDASRDVLYFLSEVFDENSTLLFDASTCQNN